MHLLFFRRLRNKTEWLRRREKYRHGWNCGKKYDFFFIQWIVPPFPKKSS